MASSSNIIATTPTSAKSERGFHPSYEQSTIITDIVQKFSQTKIRLVELSGPAGSGKSYVAEKIANHFVHGPCTHGKHMNVSCSEMVAHSPIQLRAYSSVAEVLKRLCILLEIPETGGKTGAFIRYVQKHQNHSKQKHMIIFENVETFLSPRQRYHDNVPDSFLQLCMELATTKQNNMFVILTTQVKIDFVRNLSIFTRRDIPPLSLEESKELVTTVAGRCLPSGCYLEIFKHTGGLPRKLMEIGIKLQQVPDIPGSFQDTRSQMINLFAVPSTELMLLNNVSQNLRDDLLTLSYFPGSFSAEAATAVLGSQKTSFAKQDVLSPLHSHCLISTEDTMMHRFAIQPFLRHFLEELFLLYRNSNAKARNRFCMFFAHLLKQMTIIEIHERQGERFSLFTMEIDNLQKLLLEAVHCLDEDYDLFFDVAYNAEYYITNLLPQRESVEFYESMCNAACRRSKRHHGIMLSSFGQVLGFAQNRMTEAYQQYMKALDCLRPFGESTDLAWLIYSHIGWVWYESGKFKKAERYFTLALRILRRQDHVLCRQERQYNELTRPIGLRQARILLNRSLASVLSSLGLMYYHIDNYQKSIECHEEAMEVRKVLFGLHPTIGSGYNNLCLVYNRAGQYDKALEYAKKGLQIKKVFVKQPSNTVLVSLLNVALFTHKYAGDPDRGLEYLNEAYKIREALGLKHSLTGVIEHYRGDMQVHSKRWEEATVSYFKAVHWYRVSEVSPRTVADALHWWGVALKHLERYDESQQRFTESFQITRDLMAEGHSNSQDSKNLDDTVKELDDLKRIRIEESRR